MNGYAINNLVLIQIISFWVDYCYFNIHNLNYIIYMGPTKLVLHPLRFLSWGDHLNFFLFKLIIKPILLVHVSICSRMFYFAFYSKVKFFALFKSFTLHSIYYVIIINFLKWIRGHTNENIFILFYFYFDPWV